jgi:hypothetical protein
MKRLLAVCILFSTAARAEYLRIAQTVHGMD